MFLLFVIAVSNKDSWTLDVHTKLHQNTHSFTKMVKIDKTEKKKKVSKNTKWGSSTPQDLHKVKGRTPDTDISNTAIDSLIHNNFGTET